MSLVIMDTFKGQDNDEMRKFCAKKSLEIVIPHNLTNKFQPLEISVNKTGKSFTSDKYNSWLANEVSKQLRAGKAAANFNVIKLNLNSLLSNHYMRSGLSICTTLLKMTRK